MIKYDLIAEQLLYEGTIEQENLFKPQRLKREDLLLTHNEGYWEKLSKLHLSAQEIRRTGFPLSEALVEREVVIMQGTVQAAEYAMEHGIGMNIAGGTHHAYADRGAGFCLLNDIAIAARVLLHQQKVKKVLVVDLDVHQGDGTASIFQNTPEVFTFSMHGHHNYPMHKERSDLDIPLADHTTDAHYLSTLDEHLPRLIDEVQPEVIFYQSGVDILGTDKLGKLSVTREGCKARDRRVLELSKRNNIPLVISMGGGYSERLTDIVEAHCNTFRLAQEIFF